MVSSMSSVLWIGLWSNHKVAGNFSWRRWGGGRDHNEDGCTGGRDLTESVMIANPILATRSRAHRGSCRCSGWRAEAMWPKIVVRRINKVFSWRKASRPTAAAVKKGPFFIKYQVELERGGQVYFRTHLKTQGRFEWLTSKGEKNIPGLADTTVPQMMRPKRAVRVQKLSSLPKEDDVHQYAVRRSISTENKKGPNPRTRVPKTQLHIIPYILKHIC